MILVFVLDQQSQNLNMTFPTSKLEDKKNIWTETNKKDL
jgi:hypothetical protein